MDKNRICSKIVFCCVVMTICLVSNLSFGSPWLGKKSSANTTHTCYQTIENRVMRHLPMAACDKMPLSEICIVGAVYFFFNEDPIHGVIVASVSWIIKVGQKITCNILDEDYREVYEMWVNTTFPDICIPNYVPNEIA